MLSPVSVISKVVRVGRVTVDAAGAGLSVLTADPHEALFRSEDLASFYLRIWAWNNSKGGPAPAIAASIEELVLARFTSRRDLGQRGLPAR
jgi:hypothetical protein